MGNVTGTNPDAVGQYTGLARFGQVARQIRGS
jgi:hypothetical protein